MRHRDVLGLSVAAVGFFLVTVFLPKQGALDQQKYLNPPPELIEQFHFGFADSMADSFWLRWIQDSDYCQTYLAPVQLLTPEKDLLKTEPLLSNPRHKVCDNSWSFKMLDAVTKLSPQFAMPYLAGAVSLSVLVEDFEGASVIFERGIENFPNDWGILYRAAYHFLYDKNDLAKAAELLDRSAKLGAPPWLASLAARLYSRVGQIELGIQSLKTYREVFKDEKGRQLIEERIRELEAKLKSAKPQF